MATTSTGDQSSCRWFHSAAMSSTTRERLGDRGADLERDIRGLIREIAPDGRLTEVIKSTALPARRPGEEALP